MFTPVCKEDDIWEDSMTLALALSQVVMIVWPDGGQPQAFQGVCPHTRQPLHDAHFDGTHVTCPLHNWQFDGRTGAPTGEVETGLAVYPLKIEDGKVWVDTAGVSPNFVPR